MKLIAKQDIPCFVGTDMKEYSAYQKGAEIEVPESIAKLLVARNLAKISPSEPIMPSIVAAVKATTFVLEFNEKIKRIEKLVCRQDNIIKHLATKEKVQDDKIFSLEAKVKKLEMK